MNQALFGFFMGYGQAMLCWQRVESSLFRLLYTLFNPTPSVDQVAALYYSQESFSGKLRLVGAMADVTLSDVKQTEWRSLQKRLAAMVAERNALAHLAAAAEIEEGEISGLVLTAQIHVPATMRRKRVRKLDGPGCEALSGEFVALAGRVDDFVESLSQPRA